MKCETNWIETQIGCASIMWAPIFFYIFPFALLLRWTETNFVRMLLYFHVFVGHTLDSMWYFDFQHRSLDAHSIFILFIALVKISDLLFVGYERFFDRFDLKQSFFRLTIYRSFWNVDQLADSSKRVKRMKIVFLFATENMHKWISKHSLIFFICRIKRQKIKFQSVGKWPKKSRKTPVKQPIMFQKRGVSRELYFYTRVLFY